MNLYEMTTNAHSLYELLTEGEIDEQTFNDTLEAMGVDEKLESYCKVIRQLESDAEQLKSEKERIASKEKTVSNSITRMKTAIADFLHAQGSTKSNAGIFSVSLVQSKAVSVYDESKIPQEFWLPQAPKLDKKSIRELLLKAEHVEGCELQINEGVRIK